MPAIMTHYIAMDLILNKDEPYRRCALLGSQGPDPFYYYGFTSLFKKKKFFELRSIGTLLHCADFSKAISFMINYMNKREKSDEYLILKSYIKGFILHYCLDRSAHPYIFYRTGFPTQKDMNNIKYAWTHAVFETRLDVLYRKRYNIHHFNPAHTVKINNKQLRIISNLYFELVQFLFPSVTFIKRNTFYNAVKSMKRVNSYVYSATGLKKKYFLKHDFFTMKNAISHPLSVKDDNTVDYLNNSHSSWRHPVDGTRHDASFIDLVEIAKADFKDFVNILEYKDEKLIKQYSLKFSKNLDFEGKPLNSKKIYFNIFYKDEIPL